MQERQVLEEQIKRIVTRLFKRFLITLGDIQQDHLKVLSEMKQFPPEVIRSWNYLDFVKYSRLRKGILDDGNDSIREIQAILDSFDINLKKEDKNQ